MSQNRRYACSERSRNRPGRLQLDGLDASLLQFDEERLEFRRADIQGGMLFGLSPHRVARLDLNFGALSRRVGQLHLSACEGVQEVVGMGVLIRLVARLHPHI